MLDISIFYYNYRKRDLYYNVQKYWYKKGGCLENEDEKRHQENLKVIGIHTQNSK